jgi:hypothetical protein
MNTKTTYEYRVSWVDDDKGEVETLMKLWADDGWELVSGSACPWVSKDHSYPGEPPKLQVWHAKFVMYWRKEKASN